MENLPSETKKYSLSFTGSGSEFFKIAIVNWLLTSVTLGFYYPWAKARQLKYLYSSSSFENDNFTFHGTGNEMFKGFLKLIGMVILMIVIVGLLSMTPLAPFAALSFYLVLFAVMPLMIHGSYRYRMSRTSWRGIRFGYRGCRTELVKNFYKWTLFTILTFGFYGAWMTINLRTFVLSNIRMGSLKLKYSASGGDFFVLNLVGYLLTIITLGIYGFWWQKSLFEFYINNLSAEKDGQNLSFKSTATAGGFFQLYFINVLILVFTLGLGWAWTVTRTFDFIFSNIEIEGDVDLEALVQTEESYSDALGDEATDFFDIDLIV